MYTNKRDNNYQTIHFHYGANKTVLVLYERTEKVSSSVPEVVEDRNLYRL